MADTVTTQTIADTSGVKFVAKLTNFSDGTGETLVKKIDASETTFMTADGNRKIAKILLKVTLFIFTETLAPKFAVNILVDDTNKTIAILR